MNVAPRTPHRPRRTRCRTARVLAAGLGASVVVGALVGAADPPTTTTAAAAPPGDDRPPSVLLVMVDDYSTDLLPLLPSAQRLAAAGATFDRAFVADSLCCTSRSATFTGRYPHNTGVRSNVPGDDPADPVGGWEAFQANGNVDATFAATIDEARPDYETGLIGKFLNGYPVADGIERLPGFDYWSPIGGAGYNGWNYRYVTDPEADGPLTTAQTKVGGVTDPAERDEQYVGTQVQRDTAAFLDGVGDTTTEDPTEPYVLTVAPYATHGRQKSVPSFSREDNGVIFPAAFADRPGGTSPDGSCGLVPCADVRAEDLPGYGVTTEGNVPVWADGTPAVGHDWLTDPASPSARATRSRQERAQMAMSVDRTLSDVLDRVDLDHDYVILTSDNGFHLGQHGLAGGKGTAYDSDVRVPLVVAGPGVQQGTYDDLVLNTDLAPTLEDLAGVRTSEYRDGRSLLPLLRSGPYDGHRPGPNGDVRPGWRDTVGIEHGSSFGVGPDTDSAGVPRYDAVRTADALLVRYAPRAESERPDEPAWELYTGLDVAAPYERDNVLLDGIDRDEQRLFDDLRRRLERIERCRGASCF